MDPVHVGENQMITNKQSEYLEKLLNKIISLSQNQADRLQMLKRFIHYTTVATIYEKIRKDPASSLENKKAALGNREKFEKNIKPEIDTFINQEIQQYKGKTIVIFNAQMQDYLTQIETNFSTLPQIAMELCDEAGSFIKIYRKAVPNPSLISNFERNVIQKKIQLKLLFEKEGGQKTTSVPETNIQIANIAPISAEISPTAEEIVSSDIILPEEPIATPVISTTPRETTPIEPAAVYASKIGAETKQYRFSQWSPPHWADFVTLRYCHDCGYLIHPTSKICTGCQHSYQ